MAMEMVDRSNDQQLVHVFMPETCPHALGINACTCGIGHEGMHMAKRQLTDTVTIEVLWADEWLTLSKEAELQVGGSDTEVGLA